MVKCYLCSILKIFNRFFYKKYYIQFIENILKLKIFLGDIVF